MCKASARITMLMDEFSMPKDVKNIPTDTAQLPNFICLHTFSNLRKVNVNINEQMYCADYKK